MITAEQLAAVGAATQVDPSIAALRLSFPALHFTECSADDLSPRAKPVLELPGHELYLIAGASGHCLALTNDFASATGILVAARADEE